MTLEQKAKAYDEALKEAVIAHKDEDRHLKAALERIFPELKEDEESGDDRIRKKLIRAFKSFNSIKIWNGIDRTDILAWLEKQGKQDNNEDSDILQRFSFYSYKDEPNILYLSGLYVNKECRNKGIGTKILEIADEVAKSLNCHVIRLKTKKNSNAERLYQAHGYNSLATEERDGVWLEKQSGQKSVDKVEPKFNFKVGQWIVETGKCAYLIAKINGFEVTLVDTNGNEYVFDASSLDDAHEWSIQDAMDGDVLITIDENPFIYKGCLDPAHPDSPVAYCGINTEGHFQPSYTSNFWWTDMKVYPATKEQHDTLEKAMADAGWEFDFEKKELKKIEQRIADNIPQDFEKYVEHLLSLSDGEGHGSPAKVKEVSAELFKLAKLEQNPAWSEEDEIKVKSIIFFLKSPFLCSMDGNKDIINENIKYLKSIKDRIQPKQ